MRHDYGFIAFIVTMILIGYMGINNITLDDQLKKTQKELNYYHTTYLTQNGWNSTYGSYHLVSFNGGKNWYNAVWDEEVRGGFQIIGPADPQLVMYNQVWDELVNYAKNHSPVDLANESQQQLLINAGFTIGNTQPITPTVP